MSYAIFIRLFSQLYHYVLLDIERAGCGGTFLAVRLHPLIQEFHSSGLHIDERSIKDVVKQQYGKSSSRTQHFLDESHQSPKSVRNWNYSNTKVAKCIFIAYWNVGDQVIKDIKSSKMLNNNVFSLRILLHCLIK